MKAHNGRFITLIVHRGHDGPIRAPCRCAKVTHDEICQHNGCLVSIHCHMPFISRRTWWDCVGLWQSLEITSELWHLICASPAVNQNYNQSVIDGIKTTMTHNADIKWQYSVRIFHCAISFITSFNYQVVISIWQELCMRFNPQDDCAP